MDAVWGAAHACQEDVEANECRKRPQKKPTTNTSSFLEVCRLGQGGMHLFIAVLVFGLVWEDLGDTRTTALSRS